MLFWYMYTYIYVYVHYICRTHQDSPFFSWVKQGDTAKVRSALTAGQDPNAVDDTGMTPLLWATDREHIDIVQTLLEAGSNVNAQDWEGSSALHYGTVYLLGTFATNVVSLT